VFNEIYLLQSFPSKATISFISIFRYGGIIINAVSTLNKIGLFWSGFLKNKSIYYSEAALKECPHTEIYYCMGLSHFCEMQLMLEA
jgi:hypothetical protein